MQEGTRSQGSRIISASLGLKCRAFSDVSGDEEGALTPFREGVSQDMRFASVLPAWGAAGKFPLSNISESLRFRHERDPPLT